MVGYLQPLAHNFAIVNELGYPTEYFIRWAQQKQIDIEESVGEARALEIVKTFLTEHPLQAGSGIDLTPDGDLNNSPTISAKAQEILDQVTTTQGAILFRGASSWEALPPGTATQYLKSGGPSADPSWGTPSGGGGGGGGPSWANGSGERRFLVSVVAVSGSGDATSLLTTTPQASFYWPSGTGTRSLTFKFPEAISLKGLGFLQNNNSANGTWTLEGSVDGSTFVEIIDDFALGGPSYGPMFSPPTGIYAREFENNDSYSYYRLSLNAGQSTSSSPYVQQVLFNCDPIVSVPLPPPDPNAANAWRVLFPPKTGVASTNWGGNWVGFAEIQFKDILDTILSVGGVAAASRQLDGNWAASEAFDGITNVSDNGWIPSEWASMSGDWISYTLATKWKPAKITVFPPYNHVTSFARQILVQYSSDGGVTWVTYGSPIDTSSPVAGVGQTFTLSP